MKSIMQAIDEDCPSCYLCGRNGSGDPLEWHHIFGGNGLRPLSEKYGLKVLLCSNRCHQYGEDSVQKNKEIRLALQREGQLAFQENNPDEDFMEIFGKNYL